MTEPIDDGGEHPVIPWLTQRRRAWFYRIALAAAPLLVVVGGVTETVAAVVVGIVTAIVGTGLAAANTPMKEN